MKSQLHQAGLPMARLILQQVFSAETTGLLPGPPAVAPPSRRLSGGRLARGAVCAGQYGSRGSQLFDPLVSLHDATEPHLLRD